MPPTTLTTTESDTANPYHPVRSGSRVHASARAPTRGVPGDSADLRPFPLLCKNRQQESGGLAGACCARNVVVGEAVRQHFFGSACSIRIRDRRLRADRQRQREVVEAVPVVDDGNGKRSGVQASVNGYSTRSFGSRCEDLLCGSSTHNVNTSVAASTSATSGMSGRYECCCRSGPRR